MSPSDSFSSVAFCSRQQSQCMTKPKVAATAIVTLGTAIYYLVPTQSAAELAAEKQDHARAGDASAYELVPKPGSKLAMLSQDEDDDINDDLEGEWD